MTNLLHNNWSEKNVKEINKGGVRKCGNYRGTTLKSVPVQVTARILEDKQFGYKKSTQDHILILKQTVENTIGNNKELYICYIDLEKAVDKL